MFAHHQRQWLLVVGFIFIGGAASFIVSSLRAQLLYENIVSAKKPFLRREQEEYYRDAISRISRVIRLRKDYAQYYAKKADFYLEAMNEGLELEPELRLTKTMIENLYKQAVRLHPVYFPLHLKLAWFYVGERREEAEEGLKRVIRLQPTDYQGYLYLGKYYFKQGNEQLAMSNVFTALYYSQGSREHRQRVREEILKEKGRFSGVEIDERRQWLMYTIPVHRDTFVFKHYGFPHLALFSKKDPFPIRLPIIIRVHMKDRPRAVTLYVREVPYQDFASQDKRGIVYYEFRPKNIPMRAFLDELQIKTHPPLPIEKLEFIIIL